MMVELKVSDAKNRVYRWSHRPHHGCEAKKSEPFEPIRQQPVHSHRLPCRSLVLFDVVGSGWINRRVLIGSTAEHSGVVGLANPMQ